MSQSGKKPKGKLQKSPMYFHSSINLSIKLFYSNVNLKLCQMSNRLFCLDFPLEIDEKKKKTHVTSA